MGYINHPQMLMKFILGVNPHEMDVGWWCGTLSGGESTTDANPEPSNTNLPEMGMSIKNKPCISHPQTVYHWVHHTTRKRLYCKWRIADGNWLRRNRPKLCSPSSEIEQCYFCSNRWDVPGSCWTDYWNAFHKRARDGLTMWFITSLEYIAEACKHHYSTHVEQLQFFLTVVSSTPQRIGSKFKEIQVAMFSFSNWCCGSRPKPLQRSAKWNRPEFFVFKMTIWMEKMMINPWAVGCHTKNMGTSDLQHPPT